MPKYEVRVERVSFGTTEVEAGDLEEAGFVAAAKAARGDVLMVTASQMATVKRQIGEPWITLMVLRRGIGVPRGDIGFTTAPGAYFTPEDVVELERRLTSLGFTEIQVGFGGSGYNTLIYWASRGPQETGKLSPEEIGVLTAPRQTGDAEKATETGSVTPLLGSAETAATSG